MIYTGYTQTDSYYEFTGSEGKLIMPATDVILVDDESGMISIKNTASRNTVGLLKKGSTPPTPPAPTFKWLATYDGGSTSSAECDASSAITENEITLTDLISVEIGDCVTSIDRSAFASGSTLTSVTIPDSVTSIGWGAFSKCSGLTSVNIPSGVTSIGNAAFQGCNSLANVTIPTGITSIGVTTFSNCTSLTSIVIPSGVTSIGNFAFNNCSGLTSITVEATTPPTLDSFMPFDGSTCPIYVPSESVDTYKEANKWSTYASRIQAIQ